MSEEHPLFSSVRVVPPNAKLVAISGQVAVDGDGRPTGVGDFAAQFDQTFANLASVLATVGATFSDLIKTTTFLVGNKHVAAYFDARIKPFNTWFSHGEFPANTVVVVERLAEPEFLLEVEAWAAIPPLSGM
jgi:enamine deaminase RidA (YjgF/YER057c/UK114 family)